jgi:hypothetical protein
MTSDSTELPPVHPGPSPGLLRLVKVLGAIMLLLFLALIAGIIWKATHKPLPPTPASVELDLGLNPATIRHMTLEGGQLAIATDTEILVIDVKTRQVILRSGKR